MRAAFIFAILAGTVLGSCGRDVEPREGLLAIAPGVYDAQFAQGCARLEFREPRRFGRSRESINYAFDAGCTGSVTAQSEVIIEDDRILVPGAVLTVTAVGLASFSGIWTQGEVSEDVRFQRR